MSLRHFILIFVFCTFVFTNNVQVKGMLSASSITKARRTQSMRPLTFHRTENKLNTRTQSGSLSSISSSASTSSLSEHKATDSHPIPSTSSRKQIDGTSFKEVDLHPLVEKTKQVSFISSVNLNEASVSTHSDGQINPTREGVHARVRSALLRYGSAIAIGTAISAAGVVIDQRFIHNNNTETSLFPANTTPQQSADEDGVINHI